MKIKFPVGTTEENNQLLLEPGFVTFDSERKALRLHDGITQGGFEVVGEQAYNPPPPGDIWTHIDIITPSNDSYNLLIANDEYAFIQRNVTNISRSSDGLIWTTANLGSIQSNRWHGDVSDYGRWVICDGNGGRATSADGVNWTNPGVIGTNSGGG